VTKRFITAAEVARRLDVNKSTVTRWIAAGKLTAFRTPGGHWRVRAVDVDRFRWKGGDARPETGLLNDPRRGR